MLRFRKLNSEIEMYTTNHVNGNSNSSNSSGMVASSPEAGGEESRGSSVSTEMREEYEALLRYAVVTPVFDAKKMLAFTTGPSASTDPAVASSSPYPSKNQSFRAHSPPRRLEVKIVDSEDSSRLSTPLSLPDIQATTATSTHASVPTKTTQATPIIYPPPPFMAMNVQATEKTSIHTSHDLEGGGTRSYAPPRRESTDSPVPSLLIDPETARLSNQLDLWCLDLKRNLLAEFEQSRIRLIEAQLAQFHKEREEQAYRLRQAREELERYKELLVTYEQSVGRKDHIISNLTRAMQKQKEKVDLQRTFGSWKLRHCDEKRESFASALARQHDHRKIKRRVMDAWFGILRTRWKNRVENACQNKAEEVCMELTADYEEKLASVNHSLGESQKEVASLKAEKDLYEENMKKAFMRGVCALNLEAMTMFKPAGEDTPRENGYGEVPSHSSDPLIGHSKNGNGPPAPIPAHIVPSSGGGGGGGSSGGTVLFDQRNKTVLLTAANANPQHNSRGQNASRVLPGPTNHHHSRQDAPSGGVHRGGGGGGGGGRETTQNNGRGTGRGILKSGGGRGIPKASSRLVPAVMVQRHSE